MAIFSFGKKKQEKREYIARLVSEIHWMDIIAVNRSRWYNPLTWGSKITRILTASKYSHVLTGGSNGIGWSTGVTGFPDYLFGSVNLVDYLMEQDTILVHRIPLSKRQKAVGRQLVMEQVGKKYAKLDLASMVIQNFIIPGERKLFFDTPGMVCSVTVRHFFEGMGRPLSPQIDKDISLTTPQDCMMDPEHIVIGFWPRSRGDNFMIEQDIDLTQEAVVTQKKKQEAEQVLTDLNSDLPPEEEESE